MLAADALSSDSEAEATGAPKSAYICPRVANNPSADFISHRESLVVVNQ